MSALLVFLVLSAQAAPDGEGWEGRAEDLKQQPMLRDETAGPVEQPASRAFLPLPHWTLVPITGAVSTVITAAVAVAGYALLWSTLWCPPLVPAVASLATATVVTIGAQTLMGYRYPLARLAFSSFAGAVLMQSGVLTATLLAVIAFLAGSSGFITGSLIVLSLGYPMDLATAALWAVFLVVILLVYGWWPIAVAGAALLAASTVLSTALGVVGATLGAMYGAWRLGRPVTDDDGSSIALWSVDEPTHDLPEDR